MYKYILKFFQGSKKHTKKQKDRGSGFCRGWKRKDGVTIEIPGPGACVVSLRRNQTMEQDGRFVEKPSGRH